MLRQSAILTMLVSTRSPIILLPCIKNIIKKYARINLMTHVHHDCKMINFLMRFYWMVPIKKSLPHSLNPRNFSFLVFFGKTVVDN